MTEQPPYPPLASEDYRTGDTAANATGRGTSPEDEARAAHAECEQHPGPLFHDWADHIPKPGRVHPEWQACCVHCGCDYGERLGHDDTCRFGCNDVTTPARGES